MAKKIMSLMLAVCMVLCLMPTAVFAEGSTAPADITGSGTADDPYLIYKAAGLKAFRDKVNGQNGLTKQPGAHAKLMNDIVLNDGTFDADGNYTPGASGKAAEEWTPIGNDNTSYSGTFDGNGKTIKGLYVTGQREYVGLFGYAVNATIKNVAVDGYMTAERYLGGIVGYLSGGSVTNCFNYCALNSYSLSGGIAGFVAEQCRIIGCGNAGSISSRQSGGVVGYARNKCVIQNCYNVGAVSTYFGAGGIAGDSLNSCFIACYNTGTVIISENVNNNAYVGGIIGNGFNSGRFYFCYWLKGTAKNAAGFDPEGDVFEPKAKTKAAFADGTVLNLLKTGTEFVEYVKCDFPWEKCGYSEAAGMIVPLLKGQTSDTFPIYTAEDLKTFRDSVNAGNTDINAKLMNDIVLNDGTFDEDGNYTKGASGKDAEAWEPIGWKTDDDKTPYSGTFEGNGHTVKGLYVKDVQYAGLFGYAEGATVKNMAVGGYISTSVDESCSGGIAGYLSGGSVTGCLNSCTVNAKEYAGGIVGVISQSGKVTDCGNTGTISGSLTAGGIVGYTRKTDIPVQNCYNIGAVSSSKEYAGGIVGLHGLGVIKNCYWLTGTAKHTAGFIGDADLNTHGDKSKEDFANGTVLELLKQNGTTNAWDMCGYVEAADMTLPLLKWQILNARKYDISVVDKDGEAVQITSLNQNDVLGDGTVSFVYDEANEKGILTLNGAELSSEYEFPIDAFDMENLEIVLKGKNKIQAEETCITAVNLTFSGEGSLDITNSFFYAVDCTGAVTVNGGSIKIDSPYSALCFDSAFTVNGGTVELIGAANTAIVPNFTDLVIILADDRIMLAGRFYDGSDAQVTAASDADAISEAKYVKILGKYIPVTYDPGQYGEGSAVTQNKTYGDDFGLADALFTRTGYRQTAWTTAENGGEILRLGSAYSGNEPLTLYPVWEMEQYSITYDLGGGKLDDSAPRTYMYGDTVTLPIPTKTGYTFDGWYKNSEMTGDKVTEITSTQTGDIELYAKWNECTHDWDSQKNGGWKPVNGSDDGHERICGKCSFTESGLCSKVSSNWAMEQDEHVKRCNTCKRELDRSADHKWGDWKIVKQATCTEPGKKEHTCEYCGITANEVIKAVGHSKSDKLTYSLGGDTHWYTCKNCDANLDEVKHTFDKTKVDDKYLASPATCTAPAKYYKSCECGAYTTDETFEHGEPNGHKWGDWKQLDSPTCTDNGAEIRECSVCHAKESKNIDPNGHDWENDYTVDKEPTCVKDGSKSIHCKNCDAVKDSTTINALGHTFGEWKTISAPTCTAAGTEKRVCTDCDYSETRTVDANGHKWENDYTVDKEPTCTKDGSKSIHCKNCDAVKDSKTIDALGHSFGEWSTVKQPTCTENGTKERICTVCQNKESKEIKATGHSTGKADCIHKAVCENCGDEYGDLNPDNHSNLIHINGNEATHLKEGNIEYWYCEGCHKYFVKDGDGYKEITESETKTPKTTDHKPNETGWNKDDEYHWYVCECGEVLNKDKHDCRHEVVNERCDKPGREYKQCMVCGYVEDEKEVAPKPHSYGNWIIIKKPTATSKGEQKRSCTVCGNEEVEELPIDNSQAVPNPPTDVGDNNILLWIILMFMGCGLFVSDRLFGRKKRKNK